MCPIDSLSESYYISHASKHHRRSLWILDRSIQMFGFCKLFFQKKNYSTKEFHRFNRNVCIKIITKQKASQVRMHIILITSVFHINISTHFLRNSQPPLLSLHHLRCCALFYIEEYIPTFHNDGCFL